MQTGTPHPSPLFLSAAPLCRPTTRPAPGLFLALVACALLAVGTATPARATIINIVGAADIDNVSVNPIGPYATYAEFPDAGLTFSGGGATWTITKGGGGIAYAFTTTPTGPTGSFNIQFQLEADAVVTGLENLQLFSSDGLSDVGDTLLTGTGYFAFIPPNLAISQSGFFTLEAVTTPVPEPATLPLAALGLLALGRLAGRRRRGTR